MQLDVAHAIVLAPGEGETVADRAERTIQLKAGLDAIAVTETRYEAGEKGPELHIHRHHTDAFYVLEGTLVFVLGPTRELLEAPAGSFAAAPPGVVHTFRNDGPERARYLNFHAPSVGFHDHLRASRDGQEADWFDQLEPPTDGGRPLADATLLRPGEGETLAVGGSSLALKATGENADGMFFLAETIAEPGFPGPPPHVHRELHDLFYVLDGELTLRVGDESVEAPAGTFACFPPGAVHTFSNPGDRPARFLNFNTPAGWDKYMRELAATFAGEQPPSPEAIGRIASRYDFHVAGA